MKFLSNIFDQFKTNNISGLTDELKTLYIKSNTLLEQCSYLKR